MKWLRFVLIAGIAMGALSQPAIADGLKLAKDQSTIKFVGSKPNGKHEGGFKKFTVDAEANFDDPTQSSINFVIDTTSLWSDDDKLTNHLKSADFFDVRNNPTITFESTKIQPDKKEESKAKATIVGNMVMLGKKVEVSIPIEAEVTEDTVHLKSNFQIDRTKWGMTYGQGKIDNDVKIIVDVVLKR